ncbi:MAG: DNA-directed RNA polymerase specialized sigma24 family protein [Pseudoalteromonas tetraodonis]|jgi:DNA-directed RNA polymerase specialized sigma24 family protein
MLGHVAGGDTLAGEALADLCEMYWYPLYAYARRRGFGEQDAQDQTQAFFHHLLVRKDLEQADRHKGKLRSYLLRAMQNFLSNVRRYEQAEKRGGGQVPISIDAHDAESRYKLEPAGLEDPEKLFDRRWATTLLDHVLSELEREFSKAGKAAQFDRLSPFITAAGGVESYGESAQHLNMSEGAVKVAVHRMRKRYRDLLHRQVAATIEDQHDGAVEEELRALMGAFQ